MGGGMKLSNATLKDLPEGVRGPRYDRARLTPKGRQALIPARRRPRTPDMGTLVLVSL